MGDVIRKRVGRVIVFHLSQLVILVFEYGCVFSMNRFRRRITIQRDGTSYILIYRFNYCFFEPFNKPDIAATPTGTRIHPNRLEIVANVENFSLNNGII